MCTHTHTPSRECGICLERKCNFKTQCGHNFHNKCLAEWLCRHWSCPYCRFPLCEEHEIEDSAIEHQEHYEIIRGPYRYIYYPESGSEYRYCICICVVYYIIIYDDIGLKNIEYRRKRYKTR